MQLAPLRDGPPLFEQELVVLQAESVPNPTITRTATATVIVQPRTVRNLVHSACSSCAKPSRVPSTRDR
jgi:hypothetical protein